MRHAPLALRASLYLVFSLAASGCGEDAAAEDAPAGKAVPGHITGRVTMADGKPITTAAAKFKLQIAGVSGPGENVGFTLVVKPDGTFKQKLPDGIYHVPYGTITVPFEGKKFTLKLEAVDREVGDRESAPGIAQDFVWRVTGPRPNDGEADVNNANHWYGMSVRMDWQTWRSDTSSAPPKLPKGTKLAFTLKPTSKRIDGADLAPLTIEREWRLDDVFRVNDNLHDLPPASYEITGVARLPDGTTKPIRMRSPGGGKEFVPAGTVTLAANETMEHYVSPSVYWVTE